MLLTFTTSGTKELYSFNAGVSIFEVLNSDDGRKVSSTSKSSTYIRGVLIALARFRRSLPVFLR